MYSNNNNIALEDMNFKPITIGGNNCNTNRYDSGKFTNFEDIIPNYNKEFGIHLMVTNHVDNEVVPYKLNIQNIKDMYIGAQKHDFITDEEFYNEYIAKRKPYWTFLIEKLYARGFEYPSPVQSVTIHELINYRDALVQFKSGMGKTFAFLIGLLWGLEPEIVNKDGNLQYVFMTSSHQIAQQIYTQIKEIMPTEVVTALCIGAKKVSTTNNNVGNGSFRTSVKTSTLNERHMTVREEINQLKKAHIIVCTMGKFYDYLVNKKYIPTLKYLKAFCVDEFDIIVTPKSNRQHDNPMDIDQISEIVDHLESYTQRVFFSATATPNALELTTRFFRKYSPEVGEPSVILLEPDDYTLDGIRQYYVLSQSYQEKKEILFELLNQLRIGQGIIFVNKIDTAEDIKQFLDSQRIQIPSVVFHAGLTADERTDTYNKFKDNKYRLLIATDVLSRGIDIQSINIVINFDMPREQATYIHRVGRSGRYGRKGTAITFVLIDVALKINEMLSVDAINECSKQNKMISLPEDIANLL